MSSLIQKTLCIIKPDGIRRGLIGDVISRFEKAGFKIVAAKMMSVTEDFAKKHYLYDDIEVRHGEQVYNSLIKFIISSPVLAFVIEGVESIEIVRKFCGGTEPKSAFPGTIRGDFSHHSFKYANDKGFSIYNVIHASANEKDASREVSLWFKENEILSYVKDDEAEHYYK